LEGALKKTEHLPAFAGWISQEANAALDIKKEKPVRVVLGNLPYSVSSANQSERVVTIAKGQTYMRRGKPVRARRQIRIAKKTFIGELMERYKEAVRKERNIQPLSDDYIKFIRFAHDRIERTGYGIIGMITNHSYLSGLIHRGMREELMKSFDEIYVLNLHGNALMRETAPDGGPDENVFDIRQGVAIGLFVKKQEREALARVNYADLWGLREEKHTYLRENEMSTTAWKKLEPIAPFFFFVPRDRQLKPEYDQYWSVAEIFPLHSTGFETGRDDLLISFHREHIAEVIEALACKATSDEYIATQFGIKDTSGWPVSRRRKMLIQEGYQADSCKTVLYRPFDERYTYYHDFMRRAHMENLRHLLRQNLALISMRQVVLGDPAYTHFGVSRKPVDARAFLSNRGRASVMPLYLYPTAESAQKLLQPEEGRKPNLAPEFIKAMEEKLGLRFVPDGQGNLKETFGPEDVFYYAYAVFHSPTYRTRYAEFLKIDFPRLPLTSDRALFAALAEKGVELVALHLMESRTLSNLVTKYPIVGSNEIEKVRYVEPHKEKGENIPGRVYINKEQYFEGVEPEVWNFHIGGYQVLHKWLRDRRGRILSFDALMHYQKIVVALKETMRLMEEIDILIPTWPLG